MELTYNFITGQPAAVAQSIARSIGQYEHYYRHVKVGITGNPDRRADEHGRDGWQRMAVRYETASIDVANSVEKYFITNRPELKNKWTGFSHMTKTGPYYVYFVMKTKRRLQ